MRLFAGRPEDVELALTALDTIVGNGAQCSRAEVINVNKGLLQLLRDHPNDQHVNDTSIRILSRTSDGVIKIIAVLSTTSVSTR